MAIAALGMLVAGVGAMVAGQSGRPAKADIAHEGNVIEILPGNLGFNPSSCQLNRNGHRVRFYNTDSVPRRIIEPDISTEPTAPPALDTGYIEPGEYSTYWQVDGVERINYHDADNPVLTGVVSSPQSNGAPDICKPVPPTPTPTNTPIPTPTPTPTQHPSNCDRFFADVKGCAIAPNVSQDEGEE